MEMYDAAIKDSALIKDSLYEMIQQNLPIDWNERETQIWIQMEIPGKQFPEQGWKGHVSALWYEAEKVAEHVIPILIRYGCTFKIVKNKSILRLINDCHYPMSGANKFITFYPVGEEQFVKIMQELFEELKDFVGPRIYTDVQCDGCKCLHYRYGAFVGIVKYDEREQKLKYYMQDGNGQLAEDIRKPWYQEPEWVKNPFQAIGDNRFIMVSPKVLGTHLEKYHMEKILSQANKGNVYSAICKENGKQVIVKEARPHIAYSENQTAISCLKNEYDILCRIKDKGITPKPLDAFICNGNQYLVEEWIEGKSLTKYSASYHTLNEKMVVVRNLFSVMDALYEEGILFNDLSPNNIMIMPDLSIRLIDLESASDYTVIGFGGIFATKGFYNTDVGRVETCYSKDLFGLAMSILGLYLGTAVRFSSDVREGEDARLVTDKVLEQMTLAMEEKKLPKEIRNIVYLLLLKSSQPIEEKPVFSAVLNRKLSFTETKRYDTSLDNADDVCRSFLKGVYQEARTNLNIESGRLWNSTNFGRTTNVLNIQHGVAGIAGVLLELKRVKGFETCSEEILKLVDEYMCTMDVFHLQEDNSLLFGNHGVAWFLYDFYRQRKEVEKMEASVRFALSLSGQSDVQDYALGVAGYGCTYLKFWNETGNIAFLDKARAVADSIYANFVNRNSKQEGLVKEVNGIGFAHGEVGLLYFMYLMSSVTNKTIYCDYINAHLTAYLKKVEAEINSYCYEKKKIDLSWCKGLAGIGTALLVIGQHGWRNEIYPILYKISKIMTDSMWAQSNCQCHGNAGSVEFLMDMFDSTQDDSFLYQARVVAKYIYTQRLYDSQGNAQFTDETKWNTYYDYGIGAIGAMRAILRTEGYIHGRLYMLRDVRKLK